jgi:hypothetical protein
VRLGHWQKGANVNFILARKLLVAVDQQPHGFLKVRGPESIHEVECLAAAGLVKASINNDSGHSSAVINSITDSGYAFLGGFRGESVADTIDQIRHT